MIALSAVGPDTAPTARAPLFRNRDKRFWIVLIVVVVILALYLPWLRGLPLHGRGSNTGFLTHPWRSWSFIVTALTVPGDSRLKTSGIALRHADTFFRGSAIDPHEVRLLFLPKGKPFTFTHTLGDRTVTTTITPPYRFVWQVSGHIDTVAGPDTVVALLDYRTGRVLYDVRRDLPQGEGATEPAGPSSAAPSPGATITPSAGATPERVRAPAGRRRHHERRRQVRRHPRRDLRGGSDRQPRHGRPRRRRHAPGVEEAPRRRSRPACGWPGV